MGGGDPGFSHTEGQQAHLRLAFLAEASKIFAGSLEIEDALQSLARLAVTFLTDICLIDLLEEDGSIRRMAAVNADPRKQVDPPSRGRVRLGGAQGRPGARGLACSKATGGGISTAGWNN